MGVLQNHCAAFRQVVECGMAAVGAVQHFVRYRFAAGQYSGNDIVRAVDYIIIIGIIIADADAAGQVI